MTPDQMLHRPREKRADSERGDFWKSELHGLLVERLETVEGVVVEGKLVPSQLARKVGTVRYTIYRWLNTSRISPRGAAKLIELSKGRLTKEELAPFIIG